MKFTIKWSHKCALWKIKQFWQNSRFYSLWQTTVKRAISEGAQNKPFVNGTEWDVCTNWSEMPSTGLRAEKQKSQEHLYRWSFIIIKSMKNKDLGNQNRKIFSVSYNSLYLTGVSFQLLLQECNILEDTVLHYLFWIIHSQNLLRLPPSYPLLNYALFYFETPSQSLASPWKGLPVNNRVLEMGVSQFHYHAENQSFEPSGLSGLWDLLKVMYYYW